MGEMPLGANHRSTRVLAGAEQIRRNLVAASALLGSAEFAASSNEAAIGVPFQRWVKVKEAFSPRFVLNAMIPKVLFHLSQLLDGAAKRPGPDIELAWLPTDLNMGPQRRSPQRGVCLSIGKIAENPKLQIVDVRVVE